MLQCDNKAECPHRGFFPKHQYLFSFVPNEKNALITTGRYLEKKHCDWNMLLERYTIFHAVALNNPFWKVLNLSERCWCCHCRQPFIRSLLFSQATNHMAVTGDMYSTYCFHRNNTPMQPARFQPKKKAIWTHAWSASPYPVSTFLNVNPYPKMLISQWLSHVTILY